MTRLLTVLTAAVLSVGLASPAAAQVATPAPSTGPDPTHGTISGRVVDDTGAAAAAACVSTQPTDPSGPGTYTSATTDADGRYALSVPPASYVLRIGNCTATVVWAPTFRGGVDRAADSVPLTVTQGQTTPVDLVAPRAASITGRVTYSDGTGAAGQCVRVHGSQLPDITPLAQTAEDGTYTVTGVAPGPRRVFFGECASPEPTNGEWYEDAVGYDTATPVQVVAATTTPGIDGTVRRSGVVEGRVLDEQGDPIEGACAQIKSLNSGFIGRSSCTDAEGRWRVEGLRPSTYKVYITPSRPELADLVARWYPGVPDEAAAAPVVVSADVELPTLDVTLPRGGRLSGRITSVDGEPLAGACVGAHEVTGRAVSSATTAADGTYTIRGVDLGAYHVRARRCSAGNWAPTWLGTTGDTRPTTEGLQVQLGGETTGIDLSLEPGAVVTGQVVSTSGEPIAGLCVLGYGGGPTQEDATTDADGRYRLEGFPTSTRYYVSWRDCRNGVYAREYTGGGAFEETAERLALTAGTTTELPTTVLELAGSISGAVSDARTGLRVGQVGVEVVDAETGRSGGFAFTDVSGLYRVTGIKPGRWKARFYDAGANVAVPEYWDDVLTFAEATPFDVAEGQDRPGVDADLLLITVPSVPQLPEVLPEEEGAVVSWDPPLDDGSAVIERYEVVDTAGVVLATAPGDAERTVVTGLVAGRPYGLSVRAANRKGPGPATDPLTVVPRARSGPSPVPGQRFSPLAPARLLDTRDGTGGVAARLAPGRPVSLTVAGRGGVPSSGVRAVVLNTTVTGASAPGHLTVYPGGTSAPLASNLNFSRGQTVPNLVVVPVAGDGTVRLVANAGSPHVLADVVGWYGDGAAQTFRSLAPARVLDTRDGTGRLAPGRPLRLTVAGAGDVPSTGARAVVLNVTATGALASGHLTAYAGGAAAPLASNLNFTRGQTVPNLVVVPLASDGSISLLANAGSPHVIADVVGWYGPDAGQVLHPLRPARVVDTREGAGGRLESGISRSLPVVGRAGVPTSGVRAVVVNVTVTGASAAGHLTVHPGGFAPPEASNLNFRRGQTVPNLVVVPVGPDGTIEVTANAGAPHVIGDVVGWFGDA